MTSDISDAELFLSEILKVRKTIRELDQLQRSIEAQNSTKAIDIVPLIANNLFNDVPILARIEEDEEEKSKSQPEKENQQSSPDKVEKIESNKKIKRSAYFDFEEKNIEYRVPEHCIPIRADVRFFNWKVGDWKKENKNWRAKTKGGNRIPLFPSSFFFF